MDRLKSPEELNDYIRVANPSVWLLLGAVILVLLVSGFLADLIPFYPLRMVIKWISIFTRFSYFTYGIFDYSAVLYYLSITFVFLFLTGRIFDKRRWG